MQWWELTQKIITFGNGVKLRACSYLYIPINQRHSPYGLWRGTGQDVTARCFQPQQWQSVITETNNDSTLLFLCVCRETTAALWRVRIGTAGSLRGWSFPWGAVDTRGSRTSSSGSLCMWTGSRRSWRWRRDTYCPPTGAEQIHRQGLSREVVHF